MFLIFVICRQSVVGGVKVNDVFFWIFEVFCFFDCFKYYSAQ